MTNIDDDLNSRSDIRNEMDYYDSIENDFLEKDRIDLIEKEIEDKEFERMKHLIDLDYEYWTQPREWSELSEEVDNNRIVPWSAIKKEYFQRFEPEKGRINSSMAVRSVSVKGRYKA